MRESLLPGEQLDGSVMLPSRPSLRERLLQSALAQTQLQLSGLLGVEATHLGIGKETCERGARFSLDRWISRIEAKTDLVAPPARDDVAVAQVQPEQVA